MDEMDEYHEIVARMRNTERPSLVDQFRRNFTFDDFLTSGYLS